VAHNGRQSSFVNSWLSHYAVSAPGFQVALTGCLRVPQSLRVDEAPPSTPAAQAGSGGRALTILRWVAFAACVGLFVRALAQADLPAAWSRIHAIGPLAAVVLLPFPVALAMDAWAWKGLLAAIDRHVSWFSLFTIRIGTEAVTNSAPAGALWADAISPVLVWRRSGVPVEDVFAASTAKRWTVVRMHGGYVALTGAFGVATVQQVSRALLGGDALVVIVFGAALGLVLLSVGIELIASRGKVAGRLSRTLGRTRFARVNRWVEARHHHFARADAQLARLSEDRTAGAKASLRMLGLWIAEGLESYLLMRLLGAPLGLVEVMAIDAALSVVRSSAMFAPAGIGVQDVGYLAVLEAYGVPEAASLGTAFIVLKRMKEAVWVAIGFIILARTGPRRQLLHPEESVAQSAAQEPPAAT
jgi:glycosyltransferase 2 family protein